MKRGVQLKRHIAKESRNKKSLEILASKCGNYESILVINRFSVPFILWASSLANEPLFDIKILHFHIPGKHKYIGTEH